MEEDSFRVYMVKLPGTVRGAVRLDADGFPSVYINDALAPKIKKAVLRHELRHIYRCDHTNDKSIREVEK